MRTKTSERVSPIFGRVFEELRRQAGKEVTAFAAVGISPEMLQRFETGELIPRHDKLIAALELMRVEPGEYWLMVNDYQVDYYENIMKEVIRANWAGDTETLDRIYADSRRYNHPLIALSTENLLHRGLTSGEKAILRERITHITVWTYFYLLVLSVTVDQLYDELDISMMSSFWQENLRYKDKDRYRDAIFQVGQRLVRCFIDHGEREKASFVLYKLDGLMEEIDLRAKNVQMFNKGYWQYRFGDKVKGKAMMESALMIMKQLHCVNYLAYHQKLYEERVMEKMTFTNVKSEVY